MVKIRKGHKIRKAYRPIVVGEKVKSCLGNVYRVTRVSPVKGWCQINGVKGWTHITQFKRKKLK